MKSITMLKLKVVNPPEDLERIAKIIRRGRNIGLEDWLLRQRGKPESDKQAKGVQTRKPGAKPIHPSTKIYHAITEGIPEVSGSVCAKLSSEVWSNLSAKIDWRRRAGEEGKPRKRSDAIIDYEDRPPWFTSLDIPALNRLTDVEFGDSLSITISNLMRGEEPLRLELSLKGLPPKLKKLIRRVIAGELKHSDASLRCKEGVWTLFWPVQQEPRVVLSAEAQAVLAPQIAEPDSRQSDRPFQMTLASGGHWYVGDGRYLLAQTDRLIGLRKMVGYRYRNGSAKGHGRQKADAAVIKRNRQLRNVRDEFRRRAVCDVVRQCERHGCGTLVYREPTGPAKTKCWFERNRLEFDWTRFLTDLKNSCARRGIKVVVEKLKIGEVLGNDEAA